MNRNICRRFKFKVLTKILEWFKVRYPSRLRGERRRKKKMVELLEKPKKGAALAFFMSKYSPNATVGSFRLVARAELKSRGYNDVDLENLMPEQEQWLIEVFQRVSPKSMGEWIAGLSMREYFAEETEELRRRVEAAKARREQGG